MTTWIKDPNEVRAFTFDWEERLDGDTIATSTWAIESGGSVLVITADSETTTTATVKLSAGLDGVNYLVTNTIVTAGGLTHQRSAIVEVRGTNTQPRPGVFRIGAPFVRGQFDVVRDATWKDRLLDLEVDGVPFDQSAASVERQFYIRPSYANAALILFATSAPGANQFITFPAVGQALITVPRATVVARLPVGRWQYFDRVIRAGPQIDEVERGEFIVHPGNDSL